MKEFKYEELSKATNDFSISQIIGKGSHGCIYKGSLEDGQVVAIKRCSLGLQNLDDNDSKLKNEAFILSSIPKTQYIVHLLGTCPDSATSIRHNHSNKVSSVPKMLVMEYMPNGTLHDLLHSNNNNNIINNNNSHSLSILTWEKRAQIALQIAKALQFLHTLKPKVIHRDIKSTNILLDNVLSPKLIDFGLAIRIDDDVDGHKTRGCVDSISQPAGTIGYLDPCYTTPCDLSTKIDVYSFGVVLLEIITGQKVIDTSRSTTLLIDWVLPLIKDQKLNRVFDSRIIMLPRCMEECMVQYLGIAVRCVSSNVDLRPTCDEIVSEMENCYYNYVQRTRFPKWVKFVRGFVILKRRGRNYVMTSSKKRAKNVTTTITCQRDVLQHSKKEVVPLGRLLLRDFLIDRP